MLDKLKAKMAEYEKLVIGYEAEIHEHEDAIYECGKRIAEVSAKMELLSEIIKEEESRAGVAVAVEEKPIVEAKPANLIVETAVAHEDEPKGDTIVIHYGSGKPTV